MNTYISCTRPGLAGNNTARGPHQPTNIGAHTHTDITTAQVRN